MMGPPMAARPSPPSPSLSFASLFQQATDYWIDAAQRSLLMTDVLRRRGEQFLTHNEAGNPPVLGFDWELIEDGAKLPRPTSYQLLRIVPDEGTIIDEGKRPFIIVDPRAGQGPGIGGTQASSQVGVALRAGHPVYFVSFGPIPEPTQTIEDITAAELHFLERVRERHSEAADPVLVGNCQAGWALILLSGANPEQVGPLVLAGTPLAYWDGYSGESPMRYFGGVMGGTWMGELASDLGDGRFDGAYLVQNFETLNPSNTLFKKPWRVYENIDTEAERFLEFERWWGGFFQMNAEEIRFISNELFVGNKLSRGKLKSPSGHRIDIRNIRTPIVILASAGDNITPPPQALNWVLDLYGSVEDIRTAEQTIVYCIHPDVGHLGIFVSGRLAEREHAGFIENIDLIELLPPGLYEAVITELPEDQRTGPHVEGRYTTRFTARTLDDLRHVGGRSPENTARFEAVARLSEVNQRLYQQFVQPWVQAATNESTAQAVRQMQPARLRYTLWSSMNPFFRPFAPAVEALAEHVRETRRPVEKDNPFWQAQELWAEAMVKSLDTWRDVRNTAIESWFEMVYGAPLVQAMLGLRSRAPEADGHQKRDDVFAHLGERRRQHHETLLRTGGLAEAVLRATMYILMADHSVGDQGFNAFRESFAPLMKDARVHNSPELRAMIHAQHGLLLDRPEEAVAALPDLVAVDERPAALRIIRQVVRAGGSDPRRALRLAEIEALLEG